MEGKRSFGDALQQVEVTHRDRSGGAWHDAAEDRLQNGQRRLSPRHKPRIQGQGHVSLARRPSWCYESSERNDYGEFYHFEVTLTGLEQDFSVPGPYGH